MILRWLLSLLLICTAPNNADYDAVETLVIRNPREIDESVEEAQAKLFQVDQAADAVTGIERGVNADPLFIEGQTDQITQQLKADIAKYKAAKKDNIARSDESVISLAKRILKIVTTLEVAKFIADSKARQDVEVAERRGIHRPTAYQFPQYNVGYLYGLPSRNPVQDMTQPYQEPQQDSMLAAQSPTTQSQPPPPPAPAPAPAPLPPLPAIPPSSLLPQDVSLTPPNQQGLPQGFVPMNNAFMKENLVSPPTKPKTTSPPPKYTPKQRVQPQKTHVPEKKPSGVITPENHAQWSIFGESLPLTPPAQNIAPVETPQIEQPQMPMTNQFTSTGPAQGQQVNPIPQETDPGASKFSASSDSSPQELPEALPGLRPLNSDFIKHEQHEKKPDLSVRPPPMQTSPPLQTTFPSPVQTEAPPAPMTESSPSVPPVSPPVSPLETLPASPPVPLSPPAPPLSPPPSSFSQPDLSSQMLSPMSQNVPMAPVPQPQYFVNYIPLNSVRSPVFLPDDTPDVRVAKQKEYESRRSAIAVENIEKAIGLDEKTIESLIDDVKQISLRQEIQYENAILKDKKDEQEADGDKKIKTEDKLLQDEELEGKAKETVDLINRLEKIMTIVEAAKFDAQRRANQQLLVAEAWKDRMYGRAKKNKIMKAPQQDSVKKAASVLEHIVKKERQRRNAKKRKENYSEVQLLNSVAKNGSRIKRSNLDRENPLRAKFKKIGKLAKEILRNIPVKK